MVNWQNTKSIHVIDLYSQLTIYKSARHTKLKIALPIKLKSTNYASNLHQYLHKSHRLVWYRRSRYSKNAIAYFLKEANAAALQVCSPPAVEAKTLNLKEVVNKAKRLLTIYEI